LGRHDDRSMQKPAFVLFLLISARVVVLFF